MVCMSACKCWCASLGYLHSNLKVFHVPSSVRAHLLFGVAALVFVVMLVYHYDFALCYVGWLLVEVSL